MNAALVPIKGLAAGKTRLHPTLPREALDALTLAMLDDILEALQATRDVDRIAVTTPDADVAAHSEIAGAEALLRPDPGLNAAIDAGAAALGLGEDDSLLVVLGDVAGARPVDFEALYAAAAELPARCAVLAPSGDGGSSALLRRPPDVIPSRFGPHSGKQHREAAALAGVAWSEVPLPALAVDLDSADDLRRFAASESGGPRTRALLARHGFGRPA